MPSIGSPGCHLLPLPRPSRQRQRDLQGGRGGGQWSSITCSPETRVPASSSHPFDSVSPRVLSFCLVLALAGPGGPHRSHSTPTPPHTHTPRRPQPSSGVKQPRPVDQLFYEAGGDKRLNHTGSESSGRESSIPKAKVRGELTEGRQYSV